MEGRAAGRQAVSNISCLTSSIHQKHGMAHERVLRRRQGGRGRQADIIIIRQKEQAWAGTAHAYHSTYSGPWPGEEDCLSTHLGGTSSFYLGGKTVSTPPFLPCICTKTCLGWLKSTILTCPLPNLPLLFLPAENILFTPTPTGIHPAGRRDFFLP